MVDEAIFAGLAAGGNELVNQINNKRKEELEQRMILEREARADQREEAREMRRVAREAKQVAKTELDPARGVKIMYNNQGEVIKEVPAMAHEITKAQRDESLSSLALRTAEAKLGDAEFDAAHREELLGLKIRAEQANIDQSNASAEYSRAAAAKAGRTDADEVPGITEATNQLVDDYADLAEQYAAKDKDGNFVGTMTPEEFRRNAELSVVQAKARGLDAGVLFRKRLEAFNEERRKAKKKETPVVPTPTGSGFGTRGQ